MLPFITIANSRWCCKRYLRNTKGLRYPATAEEDEEHRRKGEALLPELKSMEFLPTQASDCRAPVMAQPHARGAAVPHLRLSVHCQSPGLAGGGFRCRYSEPYTGPIRRRPNELNATRFQRGFYIEQC